MSRVSIDFAPPTAQALMYRLRPWVALVLLLGLFAAAGAGWRLWSLQRQFEALQQTLEGTHQRLAQRVARPVRAKVLITPELAGTVNAAVRQLNIPWSDLLDALEAAASPRIALLEIRPDAGAHRLLGVAEARSSEEMITYVQRLKAQPQFSAALLTAHQVNDQNRNKPVRFDFSVTWREFQP